MHWGHASSADGLHWEHHPIALAPDEHGTIFSGSIVHDTDGVAGFGRGVLVALFTHHAGDVQHQSVAWSRDGGLTWSKYGGNPVLVGDGPDFRDPKVFRHGDVWWMVVTRGDHLQLFSSPDLLRWTGRSDFTADLGTQLGVAGAGAWECPDLADIGGGHWLLVVSLAAGRVDGHSATVALPGRFADGTFVQSSPATPLDHGPDHYAFQTFSAAGGRGAIGMAWANSWVYANDVPSRGRRGVLTVPRRVQLDGDRVRVLPAARPAVSAEAGAHWVEHNGDVVVRVESAAGTASAGVVDGVAFVERAGFAAGEGRFEAAAGAPGPNVVVVDHGIVEVFAARGAVAVTAQLFCGSAPDVTVERR